MYFRRKKTKTTPVIQLVSSFRNSEGQPRQRILLSLGHLELPESLWHPVAQELENRLDGTPSLLDDEDVNLWVDRIFNELVKKGKPREKNDLQGDIPDVLTIRTATIKHRNTTQLGPELVVLKAWRELGFADHLSQLGLTQTQIRDAFLSISNRLLDPCSEHALPDWLKTTSMGDILQQPLNRLAEDRFYRVSDTLISIREELEARLSQTEAALFDLSPTIYLYDLSNTYFEGLASRNPEAIRSGNSKEKRNDCPQLAFGMVLDPQGFVVRHEVFPGNTHDSTTLLGMVRDLAQGDERPLVIIDAGMASEANLKALRDAGCDYIAVQKRPRRLAYEAQFQSIDQFERVEGRAGKPDVYVKIFEDDAENLIACHSKARGEKEKAMLSKAETRFLADVDKLQRSIGKGRIKQRDKIQRRIGRLRERHPRVARYYELTLADDQGTLTCQRHDEDYERAVALTGCYMLRTSRKNMPAQEVWSIYMMLTRVETAFRCLKSHLGLRPIYHQTQKRCRGHIFITVLAYHLLQWIEYRLRLKGETQSWPTLRRLLQTHCYTTIQFQADDGKSYTLRQAGEPDADQQHIYQLLDVPFRDLPRFTVAS